MVSNGAFGEGWVDSIGLGGDPIYTLGEVTSRPNDLPDPIP